MANFTNLFMLFASLNLALICTSMPSAVALHIKNYQNPNPKINQSNGPCTFYPDFPRTKVSIVNALPEGESLTIRCKSKDDDIGEQVIGVGQIYRFKFRPNFWGTTLYYCSISWIGADMSFDIYDYDRDNRRCCGIVKWNANLQGLNCSSIRDGIPDVFIPWKST